MLNLEALNLAKQEYRRRHGKMSQDGALVTDIGLSKVTFRRFVTGDEVNKGTLLKFYSYLSPDLRLKFDKMTGFNNIYQHLETDTFIFMEYLQQNYTRHSCNLPLMIFRFRKCAGCGKNMLSAGRRKCQECYSNTKEETQYAVLHSAVASDH